MKLCRVFLALILLTIVSSGFSFFLFCSLFSLSVYLNLQMASTICSFVFLPVSTSTCIITCFPILIVWLS
uniref:Uncharacterized protein n=1 Tax=Rhizophora mucronata TaxID=61149 RepID=A0A2P2N1W6_RHIMU